MKARIFIFSLILALSSKLFAADWKFVYVDTFDNANNGNNYGLNDNLRERSLYLFDALGNSSGSSSSAPSTPPTTLSGWVRKAGSWYDKPVIREWWSQVNNASAEEQLSFHSELSAVMLNTPITPSADGGREYSISVTTDPVVGSNSDSDWTSIMLHSNPSNRGWVTETNFGFFIKADGQMALFQNGHKKTLNRSFVPPSATYEIQLNIKPGSLTGTVNGFQISSALNETVPSTAYLYLGAYFETSGKVSTFDDLSVKTARNINKRMKNFGYYWAASKLFGYHLGSDVLQNTNFNFVESIGLINEENCPNKKIYVVQLRWGIWDGHTYDENWENNWGGQDGYLKKIFQFQRCIAAVYHLDEPFWDTANGTVVNNSFLQTFINRVKTDFSNPDPNKRVENVKQIVVFSSPELDYGLPLLDNIDYVGFNDYPNLNLFYPVIPNKIKQLKSQQPGRSIILIPHTYYVPNQPYNPTSDRETAAINWTYYNLALDEPNVIGFMNFGLWSAAQPNDVTLTIKVQKLIGKAVLN